MKITIIVFIILILGCGLYLFLAKKERQINNILEKPMVNDNKLEIKKETPPKISIITVYDNYSADSRLKTAHGFSTFITLREKNILFDTGADSETLLNNIDKMAIDPKKIDFVFISHLHGDHTGGLPGILKINPDLTVYKPDSFSKSTEITNKVWTTGPLGTSIIEQSLIINFEQGLIIITGCAHPGIVNIIKKAKEMFPDQIVNLVIGGFHLSGASDSELQSIINDFKNLGVKKVAPCHCSGDKCRELFRAEYKENFIENGVGKIIEI